MWEIKSCNKTEECYPKALRNIKTAPERLFYLGDVQACNNNLIAVIGKREASDRYLKIAWQIGKILAQEGYTVLNGLAMGVDTYALEGAVEAKGKTIAVMPGGLDEIYPKRNQKLAERILENGGCLISEYPNGFRPQKHTFVQRDRIQAMLSKKVIVVAAEKDGGTMHTIDYSIKLSKPLGCFCEGEGLETPEGNQFLIETKQASVINDKEALLRFVRRMEYYQMSLFDNE